MLRNHLAMRWRRGTELARGADTIAWRASVAWALLKACLLVWRRCVRLSSSAAGRSRGNRRSPCVNRVISWDMGGLRLSLWNPLPLRASYAIQR